MKSKTETASFASDDSNFAAAYFPVNAAAHRLVELIFAGCTYPAEGASEETIQYWVRETGWRHGVKFL